MINDANKNNANKNNSSSQTTTITTTKTTQTDIDFNQLDLNLNNLNQFFDVLEKNADQFKQMDLSGLNAGQKPQNDILKELQNNAVPESKTTIITRKSVSSEQSSSAGVDALADNNGANARNSKSTVEVKTLQGQDAAKVMNQIDKINQAI